MHGARVARTTRTNRVHDGGAGLAWNKRMQQLGLTRQHSLERQEGEAPQSGGHVGRLKDGLALRRWGHWGRGLTE
jgi:hypothetical protein